MPWLLIAIIVALVLLALILTLVMVMRSKATTGAPPPTLPPTPAAPPSSGPGWVPSGWHEPTVPEPAAGVTRVIDIDTAAATPLCADCGTHNAPGAGFCSKCGQKLRRSAHPTATS